MLFSQRSYSLRFNTTMKSKQFLLIKWNLSCDLLFLLPQDGWNQNHFITPVSTLERDRFKSHPSLSTANQQMSPIIQSGQSINFLVCAKFDIH